MIETIDTDNISTISDWLELYVLTEKKSISKAKVQSILDIDEIAADGALIELNRRLQLYGKEKPYTINKSTVYPELKWDSYPEHTMCLLFSIYGAAEADNGTKLFEKITKACIDTFLQCDSLNFGFPAGVTFKKQVTSVADSCNENRGEDPTPFDKDRGADIIAWKTYCDSRSGGIYFLVQCAAGVHWRSKKPVPIASWSRYILWNQSTTVPAISITQIVEPEKWKNAIDDYGVIIDRARIFRTITQENYTIDASIRKQIKSWCKSRI